MDIEFKHAGTSEMPYIYLAEQKLCEDHINHGIDEDDYGCRLHNIGTFADDIRTYYHKHKVRCIVAKINGICRGFIAFRVEPYHTYIVSLYVDEDFRNKGIATKMVEKMYRFTGHNTLKALIADYNVVCQKFATGIGFKKIKDSNIYGMGEYMCEVNKARGQ